MGTGHNACTYPIDLSDGRTLAPGEVAEKVDPNHPHQRALVLAGLLVVHEEPTTRKRANDAPTVKADDESADEED